MKPSKKKSKKKKKPAASADPATPAPPAAASTAEPCSPSETLTLAAAAAASETESSSSSSSCEASSTSAFTASSSGTASTFSAFSSSASTVSSSATGDERRDLAWLLDAFSTATIDQVDSAYREAGGDAFLAAGILGSMLDAQSRPKPPPPPDPAPRHGSAGKKPCRKPKKVACAASGMVADVIGKEYTRPAPSPMSVTNAWKGGGGGGGEGDGARKYSVEEAEQFLCAMLGDNSELGMGVVRDVLGKPFLLVTCCSSFPFRMCYLKGSFCAIVTTHSRQEVRNPINAAKEYILMRPLCLLRYWIRQKNVFFLKNLLLLLSFFLNSSCLGLTSAWSEQFLNTKHSHNIKPEMDASLLKEFCADFFGFLLIET
ncbi:hypothetical protein PR202_ga24230 [Eleusine coracana subsp. coracana]|uniref:At5g58720/SDE5-like UBA-like domain-containing protein n=1 Tax=Eleusine coracana subsp. coracana TaxID=191504 RepID=A0AAV5D7W1_ELECO|nr:hypothetical protein PR202_ga24230 [Eleusine coracana subsp. coracana]